MPAANGTQRCLLINDEGSFAQFARIAENRITPDATLPIIGTEAAPDTLGQPPQGICKMPGRFAELDGESRRLCRWRLLCRGLAWLLAQEGRVPPLRLPSRPDQGRCRRHRHRQGRVDLSPERHAACRRPGRRLFGRSLRYGNGLNIEGIAVTGDTLWAGLRAPSLGNRGFLVGASLNALFAPGHAPQRRRHGSSSCRQAATAASATSRPCQTVACSP